MKTGNAFPSVQFHDDYIEVTTSKDAINLVEQPRIVEKKYINLNGKAYQVVPHDDGRLSECFKAIVDKVEEIVKHAEDRIQHNLGNLEYKIESIKRTANPISNEVTRGRTKIVPDGTTITAVGIGPFEDLCAKNNDPKDLISSIQESDHDDSK